MEPVPLARCDFCGVVLRRPLPVETVLILRPRGVGDLVFCDDACRARYCELHKDWRNRVQSKGDEESRSSAPASRRPPYS